MFKTLVYVITLSLCASVASAQTLRDELIDRVVKAFPEENQEAARTMVAEIPDDKLIDYLFSRSTEALSSCTAENKKLNNKIDMLAKFVSKPRPKPEASEQEQWFYQRWGAGISEWWNS